MSKNEKNEMTHLIYRAYLRNGDIEVSGEALLLACMLHTKGKSRRSDDMKDVLKIMNDKNV